MLLLVIFIFGVGFVCAILIYDKQIANEIMRNTGVRLLLCVIRNSMEGNRVSDKKKEYQTQQHNIVATYGGSRSFSGEPIACRSKGSFSSSSSASPGEAASSERVVGFFFFFVLVES